MRKKKQKEKNVKANLETTKVLRLKDKINEKQISLSRQQPSRPKLQKVIYKSFPHNFFSFFSSWYESHKDVWATSQDKLPPAPTPLNLNRVTN